MSQIIKYIIREPGDIIIIILVIMIVIMTIIPIYTITIIIYVGNLCSIYGFSFLGRKCLMVCMCEAFIYYVKSQGDIIDFLHNYSNYNYSMLSMLLISEKVCCYCISTMITLGFTSEG